MANEKKPQAGIYVQRAREHNLKSIDAFVPYNKISVVTGLSGSGKSSLVFDTIYAEGQSRYIENLSAYARFFVSQMKKPEVDSISGLLPPVAIHQRAVNISPRSTVGTVTQTYDYLRLLFAKLGTPFCVSHHKPMIKSSVSQIAKEVMSSPSQTPFIVLAPVARGKKGSFIREFESFLSKGYTRARVNCKWVELAKAEKLSKKKSHNIDLLIDRLVVEDSLIFRLKTALEKAVELTGGYIKIEFLNSMKKAKLYSTEATCPICFSGFPELEPKFFSFNNPKGACFHCKGLGYVNMTDYSELSQQNIFYSEEKKLEKETVTCPKCRGVRLQPFALNVKIRDKNIADLSSLSVDDLSELLKTWIFPTQLKVIADKILEKIDFDLKALKSIGLGYLSLDRPIHTLSGGEAQRIRLLSQISSPLIGVLYVLDEPSIGLHPQDHHRLLKMLVDIKNRGNTILMVEHDERTIRACEHLIDLGPLAGGKGGEVVAQGSLEDIIQSSHSLTGNYLSGKKTIPVPRYRKEQFSSVLEVKGACGNNLKKIDVNIPLSCLVGVTGVSGSGKSTLIIDTLYKALVKKLYPDTNITPQPYNFIKGLELVDKVIMVNQKPIGKTSRSTPATYVGIMSPIRALMAQTPAARLRGYTPGDFSFNIKGGRCENCQGTGHIKQELVLLPSAVFPCDICEGRRYSSDILGVTYKGKNIYEILNMDISAAHRFFQNHLLIQPQLKLLEEVGLGYLSLGQSSATLSGGEAQRIKLTRELAKKNTDRTVYILDEPTTGLHFKDVENLILVLKKLVEKGSTVIVIEHQMDLIKSCDYLIDLGPGGGQKGGQIVVQGAPEKVIQSRQSCTAPYLKMALSGQKGV